MKFLEVLLRPFQQIVKGADIVFYVCGSIVKVAESLKDIKGFTHE